MLRLCIYLLMHYLFTPAFLLLIPICCCIYGGPECRRGTLRTLCCRRSVGRAEERAREERFMATLREYNSNSAVTGVIAVTGVTAPPVSRAPSKELFFVSPEAAAKNETAVGEPVNRYRCSDTRSGLLV